MCYHHTVYLCILWWILTIRNDYFPEQHGSLVSGTHSVSCARNIIIIIIIILVITSMQGIYNYIPETNHISRVISIAAVLYLQFVLRVMLFRPWNTFCLLLLLLLLLPQSVKMNYNSIFLSKIRSLSQVVYLEKVCKTGVLHIQSFIIT
jgi:hypothetical protein